jgi:citrate synthase
MHEPYLTAREAAELLGIRLETLYAYVSRGLLRSEKAEGAEVRARRYLRQDVEALRRQKDERRTPAKVLEHALDMGGPLLESAITLIADGRLYYRGRDAIALSRTAGLEEVASLIWGLEPEAGLELFHQHVAELPPAAGALGTQLAVRGLPPLAILQGVLPLLAHDDPAAYDLRPATTLRTAARAVGWLVQLACGTAWQGDAVSTLAAAWRLEDPAERALLRAALILCVDHELNVSAFTARCIASANATLYDAVAGGLAALHGARHGGHTRRVEALLQEIGEPGQARQAVAERLRRGEDLPGFGHRLYPDGDPRALELLARVRALAPDDLDLRRVDSLCAAVYDLLGERPSLDTGLILVARRLRLPPDSALTLFALGRAIGWLGHALEQYPLQQLIRPRARYTGTPPAHT